MRAESEVCLGLGKTYDIIITLVWASINCESKMEKQDLQAGESRWQNSNYTTS